MIWIVVLLSWAWGAEIKDIPQLGPHYRIVTLDKNENPQNLLAVYTKLRRDCSIENRGNEPVLGYYWLMNGERYKRVNPLILQNIRKRLQAEPEDGRNSFNIAFNDLKELDTDIAERLISVESRKTERGCQLEAHLRLGPSDGNQEIRLTGIHSEAKKIFWPPFRKLISVTLSGFNTATGKPVKRTYLAKH